MARVSILVETENIAGDAEELRPVLDALVEQVGSARIGDEVIIVTAQVGAATVAAQAAGLEAITALRVLDSGRCGYYEAKNLAASRANGDILVFIDSDTVPEVGWLTALVAPFADPDVEFVGGATSYGPLDSARAWAVYRGATFAPRSEDGPARSHDRFVANNFAARRDLLADYRFDTDVARARGHCWSLARRLLADGHTIWTAPSARVMHAVPEQLLRTAYAEGRDMLATERVDAQPVARAWMMLSAYCVKRSFRVLAAGGGGPVPRWGQRPTIAAYGVAFNVAAWLGLTVDALGAPRSSHLR